MPLIAYIPETGLLFGLLLLAAIAGAWVAHLLRLPHVIGYLVGGAAMHLLLPTLLQIEPDSADAERLEASAQPLKAIKDLGLGIILFTIGGVFETRHLKALGQRVLRLTAAESGLTLLLVFALTLPAALLVRGTAEFGITVSFAFLLGLAAIATAPAATLFTLREYEAKGPVTDAILGVVGLNNVLCIVLFNVAFLLLAAAGALGPVDLASGSVLPALALQVGGSLVLGIALAYVLSLVHGQLRLGETLLVLTATLIVLGAGESWLLRQGGLSYNFLLTTLCLGAVFANVAIDPDRLAGAVQTMGRPILVGFFAIAGYRLHIEELAELGWVGAAYVVARTAGKFVGGRLGVRWADPQGEIRPYLGAALLCQAAVVLGLADFVHSHWQHPWAERAFFTTVLGSVVIFELCGPLLIKWTVLRAGEVKETTLLRHQPSAAETPEPQSVAALTWQALTNIFGGRTAQQLRKQDELRVRHIMRTSVKCLRLDDRLDDVLHFVERSRFNHFPVVDDRDRLVGVIHFSDIRGILYDPMLRRLVTAADLARLDTPIITVDMPLLEVLLAFHDGDIGSLPVLDGPSTRKVVGIVEQRDVLKAQHQHEQRKESAERNQRN